MREILRTIYMHQYFSFSLSLFTLSVLQSLTVFGQSEGYYDSAEGLANEELKMALHLIIDDHQQFSYTSSSTDVWDILKATDRDPENPDNVIMLYSGRSIDAAQEYNSGNGWTREHVWPQSRGDFGTSQGIGTDVHHIRPCENSVNSIRSNRSFAYCGSCVEVSFQGDATGSFYDNSTYSFEPRDEVKGDVARMILYMDVRYEDMGGELNLELSNNIIPQGNQSPLHGKLDDLLLWHEADPVDNFEINRNNIIYEQFQGNRNPFIDYPELVDHLWGDLINVNWEIDVLSAENAPAQNSGRIYPNPIENMFHYTEPFTKIEVFDQMGKYIGSHFYRESIDLSYLDSGVYFCRVFGEDGGMISTQRLVKL